MEKLQIGVIGLGMGRNHIKWFNQHPRAKVIAAADLDHNRLDEVCDQLDVPNRYSSAEALLERDDLDIISIATPNKSHYPLTIAALGKGCHVLCEKPMAMSATEGQEMLAAAEAAGKRLMINFNYRFSEQSMMLKKQVDFGAIGEVYFGRTIWHRRRGIPHYGGWFGQKVMSGGGPLIDLGVHRLDLALWFMGYPKPTWVMGSTYNHISRRLTEETGVAFDVEDLAVGMIRFENGATLELEASWAANIQERELMETRLLGTKGGLIQRNFNEGYQFEAELYLERDGGFFDMKLHPPYPPVHTPMFHFVEAILTDTPHIATAQEGILVMEILDAIYQSAETGQPVQLG